MKKLWKKIENNKFLFGLFILFVFILFLFITNGLNGYLIDGWYGITYYIENLTNTTSAGKSIFNEILWSLCLIPIILIFKNKYIFSEKKLPFKERIKIIWPMLILTMSLFIFAFSFGGGFTHFNLSEFIAILILCSFVGIFEEILCRGWLQNELIERFGNNRKGVLYSIVLSGFIFGSTHIINYFAGQNLSDTIFQIISAIIFGIYIGSVYFKTKNIWTCVFLHGLWDFSLFMLELNKTSSCVSISTPNSIIMQLFLMIILDLPGILTGVKLLEKVSLEKTINEKAKFTDEELDRSNTTLKIASTIQIVVVSVLSVLFVFVGLLMIGDSQKDDKCMLYDILEVNNASFTNINYRNYEINSDNYILNVKLLEDGLVIKNLVNNADIKIDIDNTLKLAVFRLENRYVIEVLSRFNENYVVYYSDYITDENILDSNLLENIKTSFKMLELPSTINFGYYTDENNKVYPWFESEYETYYIKDNDEIKKLYIKK